MRISRGHGLACLALLTACGGGSDAETAARDRARAKEEWKISVDEGGTAAELALEQMDIYLTENDSYPEIWEMAGEGVVLVGQLPKDARVDYEEAFEKLVGRTIVVEAQGGDPRQPKSSAITLGGVSVPVSGGFLVVEKVTGKWGGSEGDRTLHGTVELQLAGGTRTARGKFAVHAVTWG
jgi:hypothetical protein